MRPHATCCTNAPPCNVLHQCAPMQRVAPMRPHAMCFKREGVLPPSMPQVNRKAIHARRVHAHDGLAPRTHA
eukprot:365580-Chlamydomonas_euryale.AAC.7